MYPGHVKSSAAKVSFLTDLQKRTAAYSETFCRNKRIFAGNRSPLPLIPGEHDRVPWHGGKLHRTSVRGRQLAAEHKIRISLFNGDLTLASKHINSLGNSRFQRADNHASHGTHDNTLVIK